ncbi:MAG: hypothetical protein D6727_05220 [Gammaproteobacteria bacterium]|nr:MAG: hypothetical protein D6727_05220 [Gammaproteobacteria bacterium]
MFAAYREAWAANSAERLESFWATDEPAPFYKAEEIDRIITDWDELRAYWRHNETFNETIDLRFDDLSSVPAGPGRCLAGLRMQWSIRFAADARTIDGRPFSWAGQTMGGENHVAALLSANAEQLRFCAWVEAPNAPLSYIAKLYLERGQER